MPITLEDVLDRIEKGESLVGEGLRGLCFDKLQVEKSGFVGCDFSTSHFMKAVLRACRLTVASWTGVI